MRRRDRALIGWGIALATLGVVLCAVPLFDLLGFEFCFALGIVASFAGSHVGAEVVDARRRSPAAAVPAGVGELFFFAWGRLLGLMLVPLLLVSVNAVRVRNCNYGAGLLWFLLLPGMSAAAGAAAGVVASLCLRSRPLGMAAGWLVVLASIALGLWRFYAAPPIFGYDPFVGYFPGTLYDEELSIPRALLWARAYHVALIGAALAAAAAGLDGRALRLRLALARGRPVLLAVTAAFTLAALILHTSAARLGFELDAGDIARVLGGRRETAHFVLYYSPSGPFAHDLDLWAEDHEFRYAQLERLMRVHPPGKVTSFLFDSAEHKRALMGAAHTSIAKPWRREIYLQHEPWPHPVLRHELAHVFAGGFGDPIFHVSRRGARFNVGLIEGVAVAADWPGARVTTTPDQALKAMRAADLAPPLTRILGTGFLTLNSMRAYTAAGSFCRFLLERNGIGPLAAVYHEGGSAPSFAAAYGVSLEKLAGEWLAAIDKQPLAAGERALLLEQLRKRSVFRKVCAHEVALLKREARQAQAAGDAARALADLERICGDDPADQESVADLMDAAVSAGRLDEARGLGERLLASPDAGATLKARALMAAGDAALERGGASEAARKYQQAAELPLEPASARLLTVKRLAAREAPGSVATLLKDFVLGERRGALAPESLDRLSQLTKAAPERGLFHYLLGRQLDRRGRNVEAAVELERALGLGLPDDGFVSEAERLLGLALHRLGRFADARRVFAGRAGHGPEATRLESLDLVARVDFALAQRRPR